MTLLAKLSGKEFKRPRRESLKYYSKIDLMELRNTFSDYFSNVKSTTPSNIKKLLSLWLSKYNIIVRLKKSNNKTVKNSYWSEGIYDYKNEKIVVYFTSTFKANDKIVVEDISYLMDQMISTIIHELVHYKQHINFKFKGWINPIYPTFLNKKLGVNDIAYMKYMLQEIELEAYGAQYVYMSKYANNHDISWYYDDLANTLLASNKVSEEEIKKHVYDAFFKYVFKYENVFQ